MKLIDLMQDILDYKNMPHKLPKRIKYKDVEFHFDKGTYYSVFSDVEIMAYVSTIEDLEMPITKIKIGTSEFEDIEEFDFVLANNQEKAKLNENGTFYTIRTYDALILDKLNKLIRNQLKLIDKMNKEDVKK